jgi:hypothetical protein
MIVAFEPEPPMSMRTAIFALIAAAAIVSAPRAQEPSSAQPVAISEDDAFILMVDIGRTGVFIDRTRDALGLDIPHVLSDGEIDAQTLPGMWRNLRVTGREAVVMHEIYCSRRMLTRAVCTAKPPAFISAQPNPVPDKAAIEKHLAELQAYFQPVLDAGCTLGKKRTGDAMFCSVE